MKQSKLDRWNKWQAESFKDYLLTLERYVENPLTHYHRVSHVYDCFFILSDPSLSDFVTSELKFAILYHDVVYKPGANDNEENSAALAFTELSQIYHDDVVGLNKIVDLILLTKHTGESTDDVESQCMLDIDLSILGSNSVKYKWYADLIRMEYSFVSDEDYVRGRITFLGSLLHRPKIYYKLTNLEEQARTNINNEILYLRGKL